MIEIGSLWRHRAWGSVVRVEAVDNGHVRFRVHLSRNKRPQKNPIASSCAAETWETAFERYTNKESS